MTELHRRGDRTLFAVLCCWLAMSLGLAPWQHTCIEPLTIGAARMVMTALAIHQAHGMLDIGFDIGFDIAQRAGVPIWVFAANTGFGIVLVHAAYVIGETALLVWIALALHAESAAIGCDPAELSRAAQDPSRQHAGRHRCCAPRDSESISGTLAPQPRWRNW